jgi:flagellar hook protein FlgE
MIETIYIGMSGLTGYSSGLRGIANNVANLNTPGFKSSSLSFSNLFYSNDGSAGSHQGSVTPQFGHGLATGESSFNFRQGDLRQTGNTMDLAVEGQGLFVLRDPDGQLRYTRAGQFEMNTDGFLVDRVSGAKVMGLDGRGQLTEINITSYRVNAPKSTGKLSFAGNLDSSRTDDISSNLSVVDAAGAPHALTLKFTAEATPAGRWKVALMEGTTSIGTSTIDFVDGRPKAGADKVSFTYTPAGQPAMPLTLDFSGSQVTSFASSTLAPVSVSSKDGYEAGAMSKFSFDAKGELKLEFANGQTSQGPRLALANVDTPQLLEAVGGNSFTAADGAKLSYGTAGNGSFGSVRAGSVEISNVDLSQEFSDMVIMQRGYQASAQIVSTANDMLQELFGMKR